MDVSLNVPVYCTDGLCGHVSALTLKAKERTIKAIVVKTDTRPPREWLVPLQDVVDSSPDHLRLNCNLSELAQYEPFRMAEYVAVDVPRYQEASEFMCWGDFNFVPKEQRYIAVEHPNLDVGEMALSAGARVRATDGPLGRVRELLVDSASGALTHIVLKKGHLWGQKEVTIPAEAIDFLEGSTIHLNLSRREIEELPTKPARPTLRLAYA